jgi:hemolysin III
MDGAAWRRIGGEEIANALTHGTGVLLSLAGLAIIALSSLQYGNRAYTAAVSVYGLSLVAVFGASTLYHASTSARRERVYLWMDHACIHVLIAGTYTPFALTVLKGAMATGVLAAVWSLGAAGVAASAVPRLRASGIAVPYYLIEGALVAAVINAVHPLPSLLGPGGFALLAAGGVCYGLGLVFFFLRVSYAHAVWHVFVLAGGALHYFSVLRYTTPA